MAASAEAKRHAAEVVRALRREYPDADLLARFPHAAGIAGGHDPVGPMYRPAGEPGHPGAVPQVPPRPITPRPRWPSWKRTSRARAFSATRRRTSRLPAGCWSNSTAARCRNDIESLVELPGVGRKTANVVLGTAFGIASGVVVDTHVARVSRRLGLTAAKGPGEDRAGPDGVDSPQGVDRASATA